jgi:hypothetical protein
MRWGYDNSGAGGFYTGSANGSTTGSAQHPAYGHVNHGTHNFKPHGHKRAFSSAFEKLASTVPRTPAPPAVPSFGNPLPAKPPPPLDASRKTSKKKKRKFNQLGLTPKTEEHESSEEEDDVDEEARLAAGGSGNGPVQFTFKGRTSALKSATEIALWIEERKKRYPTQARVEEKKKELEEAKKAKDKQREETQRQQRETRAQQERAKREQKEKEAGHADPIDAAVKAKLKAEKLRKKLLKEEKRVAKAEADAERARLKAEAIQQALTLNSDETPRTTSGTGQPETALSSGVADHATGIDYDNQTDGARVEVPAARFLAPSTLSDVEDDISSVSSVSDDDDSGDEDSAPDEASSRRQGPERVLPPPREDPAKRKKPCRHFVRTGRCSRGEQCRFLHELPGGGAKRSRAEATSVRPKQDPKRGLFQMVCFFKLGHSPL